LIQLKNSTTLIFPSAALLALAALCLCSPVLAQDDMVYRVRYDRTTPGVIHVSLGLTVFGTAPLTLIMPRSFPGGYDQRPYDPYVSNVKAFGANGDAIGVRREELGPRWSIGQCCTRVTRIEYDVDLAQMEREIFAASDSSKIRDGYVGLLGYSVFAFLDGWESRTMALEIAAPEGWPVFATLAPNFPAPTAALTAHAPDYYALADSQIMMGPKLQLRRIDGGIPLFVAAYVEGDADLARESALA
jgi:predicted metalloprotease with PDZ domain